MARLFVHVEGQTEEAFVDQVLAPHLYAMGYQSVVSRRLGHHRARSQRGGIRSWASARRDIVGQLRGDPGSIATTMVDFYGLPQEGDRAWPGRAEAGKMRFPERADHVERCVLLDVATDVDSYRFVPFVVMHEFEGLLFSDPAAFCRAMGKPSVERQLREIRESFATPEEINDSQDMAPSKRIERIVRDYQKPLWGVAAALATGLETIRAECPHFDGWVRRLEELVI